MISNCAKRASRGNPSRKCCAASMCSRREKLAREPQHATGIARTLPGVNPHRRQDTATVLTPTSGHSPAATPPPDQFTPINRNPWPLIRPPPPTTETASVSGVRVQRGLNPAIAHRAKKDAAESAASLRLNRPIQPLKRDQMSLNCRRSDRLPQSDCQHCPVHGRSSRLRATAAILRHSEPPAS